MPEDGIYDVTCEGGEDIIHLEKKCRRGMPPAPFCDLFHEFGPNFGLGITSLGLEPEYDFCSPKENLRLREILKQEHHYLHHLV